MWRPSLVAHWLGAGSFVSHRPGRRVLLSDEAGAWRRGRVTSAGPGSSLTLALEPGAGWMRPEGGEQAITFELVALESGTQVVCIRESGPDLAGHRAEIESYWAAALDRLADLVSQVRSRRDHPRQAVVVIHGIGEQEPGHTLRALVRSGVVAEADAVSYVKPDRLSDLFELHSMTFQASPGRARPTTDVFELYWAHVINDTTLAQVVDWLRGVLFRRAVPRPLRPVWLLTWGLIVAVAAATLGRVANWWSLPRWLTAGGLVAVAALFVWRLVGSGLLLNVLGDAARYLSPRPANVAHRQAIRQGGVELLQRLHDSGRYDRVVVLGHSLGSVIAYDVLTAAWHRYNTDHQSPQRPTFGPLRAVERAMAAGAGPEEAQAVQHDAWRQTRRNTQPWLVTDLVTVGSPLTYAGFLMASSRAELRQAQEDRVLPTCPPQAELEVKSGLSRCTYEASYGSGRGRRNAGTFTVFNHGAPFAVTRWANLYFTTRWGGLVGDLVGGPLGPELGPWIRDEAMPSPARRVTHTWYWRPGGVGDQHLGQLRRALDLDCAPSLRQLAAEIPAYAVAERLMAGRSVSTGAP